MTIWNETDDWVVAVRAEQRDDAVTGMHETLIDLGVPKAVIEAAVDADGTAEGTFLDLLRAHTAFMYFEDAEDAAEPGRTR